MEMDHLHGEGSSSSSNLTDSRFTHMCTMNMLWNWEVIDSCFISDQWHVTNEVGFALSIVGIFLITFLIEGIRRAARNYDRMLAAKHAGTLSKNGVPLRPTMSKQLVRGGFYGVQFSAAYVLMLIAMSYNGFALFAIFLGGAAGYVIFSTDTLEIAAAEEI
ncbi:unnamed protein product [Rhizoctonia solani]|uniref:Copper transport protein n=1 Tax=Rhizoctonia solani TaxID=456999 RepID=A0A8H2WXI2_9AGAM|nr:unnamed protein product [Rhizoctonia solani]CAE6492006.1 unnamed protein product [Rhizoctonia solani]